MDILKNKLWNGIKGILNALLASYVLLAIFILAPTKLLDVYFENKKKEIELLFAAQKKTPSIFDKPFQFEGTPPSSKPRKQYQMKEGMYVSKYDYSIIMEIDLTDPIYQDCDEYLSLLRAKTSFEERLKDFK